MVHWIEAGAPRGKGPDPLAELHKTWPEWAFGKPDMVVEVPAFDIPATGIIDYQRYVVPNTTGRDVWVRATDIIPGERTVVHHVIVGVYDPKIADERMRMIRASSPSLGAYVPGNGPTLYPQDTGVLVRKDQAFAFQMHYTTSGKPAHDVTRFGLYFRDSAPTYEFKTVALANPKINDSAEHEGARRDDHAAVPARHDHLSADAARAFPRPRLAVHRELSGWPRGAAAVGAEVRLQLADDVHARDAEAGPGGHEDRAHDGLRQLVAEPGESGSEPDRAVGRAVVRRDAVRRRAVPRADAGRTHATQVSSNAGK